MSRVMETEPLEVEEGHGLLCLLDESGDSRMQWDKNDPVQVAKAQARFDELKAKGYLAYSVNKKGDMGEVLAAFDASAERIIMHSALVGG
jgi:acetyl-CoA carboxylase beta subunit